MKKSIPKSLLVVKNRAIGDTVMTLGTLQYLSNILPQTKIYYGVPSWIAPLYKNVHLSATEVLPLSFKNLDDWRNSHRLLKSKGIDHVLELFQSGRTNKFFTLWKYLGGPNYSFHNHHKKEGLVFGQGEIKSNIQRDLDAAWTFFDTKNPAPPSFLDYEPSLCPESEIEKTNSILLGCVATRDTKMWPLQNYAEFTHIISKHFPDTRIVIPLGPGDEAIRNALAPLVNANTNFLETPLEALPLELSKSLFYIGNDTGLKHISISLGIETFTLFGPEPPTEWHPYNKKNHDYYFKTPLECRTRQAHFCGLSVCDSMICLNEFTASDLFKTLEQRLSKKISDFKSVD